MPDPRPVSQSDFELETLEPRLLLNGDFTWVNATGGDWDVGANWQGGVAPNASGNVADSVIIQGLNPGAVVNFGAGAATFGSLTVTGSLNVTGGTMTVTGGGTVSAGSTLAVAGGTFVLNSPSGTLTNNGAIQVSSTGIVNLLRGTLKSENASIQLSDSGAINVLPTSGQSSTLWLNSTLPPPSTALAASGSSTITLGEGGNLRVGSTVVLTGTAHLQQTGGILSFEPVGGTSNHGSIDALASTHATALNLLSGTVKGTGYASSTNIAIGVTLQPGLNGQGALEFGISGTATFLAGAALEIEFFPGATADDVEFDQVVFSDPVSGAGTYEFEINELDVRASAAAGYVPTFAHTGAQVLIFTPGADVSGAITRLDPVTPANANLTVFNSYGLRPLVDLSTGVTYSAESMDLSRYFVWVGPSGGDWYDGANWRSDFWFNTPESWSYQSIFASWFFSPPSLGLAPTFFSNVIIPDQHQPHQGGPGITFSGNAVFSGYGYFNSVQVGPQTSFTIQSGHLYLAGLSFTGDPGNSFDGLSLIPSQFEGTTHFNGGLVENRRRLTIGMESAGLGSASSTGGRLVTRSGATTVIYRPVDFSGAPADSFIVETGGRLEILGTTRPVPSGNTPPPAYQGSLNLGSRPLEIPFGATLLVAGRNDYTTLTVSTLTVRGELLTGYNYTINPIFVYVYGTLKLQGDLVLAPTSKTTLRIASDSASDAIVASGNISTAGTLEVSTSPFYGFTTPGGTYAIIQSTGGIVSGTFATRTLGFGMELNTNAAFLEIEVNFDTPDSTNLRDSLTPFSEFVRSVIPFLNLTAIDGSAFNLPVVINSLDDLFGLSANPAVSGFTLPTFTAAGTDEQIVDALVAQGYVIDFIAGGLASRGIPDFPNAFGNPANSGNFIQVRYSDTLLENIAIDAGYSGPEFNTDSPGLLGGLAAGNALEGLLGWTASLSVTLIFGLKQTGELFIHKDSVITLALAAQGNISSTVTIGGQTTTISGTAEAELDVTVSVGFDGFEYYHPFDNVVADLESSVVVGALGTTSVDLTTTVGPLDLNYQSDWDLFSFVGSETVVTQTATLDGTLNFPGLTSSVDGTAQTLSVSGFYTSSTNTWTLSTSSIVDTNLHGLQLNGSLNIDLNATSLAGSGTLFLRLPFVQRNITTSPSTVQLNLVTTFNATSGTMVASPTLTNAAVQTETGTRLVSAASAPVSASLSLIFASGGSVTGAITLSATSGSLLPDSKYTSAISDGADGNSTAFTATYDIVAKTITLALDQLTVTVPYLISFAASGLTLTYNRTNSSTTQTLGALTNHTVTLLPLNNVSSTGPPNPTITTTVTFRQDGFSLPTSTSTLTSVLIGNVFEFASLSFSLTGLTFYQGSSAGGTVAFSADSAIVYPNSPAIDFELTTVTGAFPIGGSTWTITAGAAEVTVGEAYEFSQSNLVLTFNTGLGTVPQVMASLTGVAVNSALIENLTAASLSFDLFSNGFELGSFTMTPGSTPAGVGDWLQFTGASLVATDFRFIFSGDSLPLYTGSVAFNFSSMKLYPGVSLLTTTVTDIYGIFDFGTFTSVGQLQITLDTFRLRLGSALQLDANPVMLRPGQSTFITLTTARLTSPLLTGMEGTVTNLHFTANGFVVGNADLSQLTGQQQNYGGGKVRFNTLSFAVGNFSYNSTTGFSGTITLAANGLLVFPDNPKFSFTAQNVTGSIVVNQSSFDGLTLSLGLYEAKFGGFLTLYGTNLVITPDAATVLTVNGTINAKLNFGGVDITGSGGKFAIASDGSLVTLPGFGVALSIGTSTGAIRFPSWLGITITQLGLSWADFNANPADFDIILSASVTGLNGLPFAVSGTVSGLVISPGAIAAGQMPIKDVGSVSITISGPMFGGTVSGTIFLGVMKFDANGDRISAIDTTTPVAERVFYGGIRASFTFSNLSGFSISIGLSELGPIDVYVSATTNILIDPASGLTLAGVAANVQFNTSLPSFTDPFDLRNSVFNPLTNLTDSQWVARMEFAVANQAHGPPGGSFWDAFSQTMLIKGSATFTSAYSSTSVFRAQIDLAISTDGKFAVTGTFVFGNSLNFRARLYGDLTQINQPNSSVRFLFLLEDPAPPASAQFSVYGSLLVQYSRTDGQTVTSSLPADSIRFVLTGGVKFKKAGLEPKIEGSVELTYGNSELILRVTGRVNVRFLGDVAGANGVFHLDLADPSSPKFWGALNVQTNFSILESYGIFIEGSSVLRINTTTSDKTEVLTVPGQPGPVTVQIAAGTFSLFTIGVAKFKLNGQEWFSLDGQAGYEISDLRVVITQGGNLRVGPASAPLLSFTANGFLLLDDFGLAAQITVGLAPNTSSIPGTVLNGSFTFILNTRRQAITYTVPGGTTFTIPAVPPNVSGAIIAPYALITGSANLRVLNTLTLTGDFHFVVGTNLLDLRVTNGTTALSVNGTTLFSWQFSGGLRVDSAGVAASIGLSLVAGTGNNSTAFGFNYAGGFTLELNTTGVSQTIGGTTLTAGPFLRIVSSATISVNFSGGFFLAGTITFAISPTEVTATLSNGVLSMRLSGFDTLQFTVSGGFSIINENANNRGLVLSLAVGLSTNLSSFYGFTLSGSFRLDLNTTNSQRTIASLGVTVPATSARVMVTGTLTAFGVAFAGSFEIFATASFVRVTANATFDFTAGGTRVFQFNVGGAFQLDNGGLSAVLTVTQGLAPPATSDIALTGTFVLHVNTTNNVRVLNGTTLSAGQYVRVIGTGALTVMGIGMNSTYTIQLNAAGFVAVTMTGELRITSGSTLHFLFSVSGALQVGANGVAASIGLGLIANPVSTVSLNATLVLQINTTGSQVTFLNGTVLAGGADYFRVVATGSMNIGAIVVAGTFTLHLSTAGVSLAVTGTTSLKVAGTTVFGFNVAGTIAFDSGGIFGALGLTLTTSTTFGGFNFSLGFRLDFNSAGTHRTITYNGSELVLGAGPYVRVFATGSLTVSPFTLNGTFIILVASDRLEVHATATTTVLGISTTISGTFGIFSDGLVLGLRLGISTFSNSTFSLSGSFVLELNTTGQSAYGVPARSLRVGIHAGSLTILGITLRGSIYVGYTNGNAYIEIPASAPISLSFFNFGSVGVSGRIEMNGTFRLTGVMSVNIGRSDYASVGGTITVTVTNSGISGSFSGNLYVFSSHVASVSGSVTSESFTVSANISFKAPGVNLRLNGLIILNVARDGVWGSFFTWISGGGKLFGGVNVSGSASIDTRSNSYSITASFSISVGGSNLGASLTGTVTVGTSGVRISGSGSAWAGFYIWNPFGDDWWVGGTVSASFSGDSSGKFSIGFSVAGRGFSISVDLSSIIQNWGSDIAGGYAFLDTTGNGVWDPTMPRVAVDQDGSFTFNVGDESLWRKDAGNTFAFQDLNGNGAWDADSEARLALVNGQLPTSVVAVAITDGDATPVDPATLLGLLQAYATVDSNGVASLNPSLGRVMVRGGLVIDPNTGVTSVNTGARELALVTAGYTGLVGTGQVVFFDTNGNSILDAGEVSVNADSRGFFTFTPTQQQLSALGILAGFDTNGNGRIDPSEGTIVLAGGVDKHNGQPVETITRISAETVGSGLAVTANPLATLQQAVVLRGIDPAQVNVRLSLVFDLPVGLDFGTLDVQTAAGLSTALRAEVLRLTSQIETYLLSAGSLISASGLSDAAAQQAALDSLVDRVLRNFTAETQNAIQPADRLDLSNVAELTALITSAVAEAGISPASATIAAVAQVTAELNLRAAAYAASSSDLARDLARIDAVAKGAVDTAIHELAIGNITVSAFLASYTGAALDALITGIPLTPLAPPAVDGIEDVTVSPGDEPATLDLHLSTSVGIASNIVLTATSSDTSFLPNASLVILGSGADRVLVITPAGDTFGSVTITLTATINGQTTTETFVYTVGPEADLPPVFVSVPPGSAVVDQNFSHSVVATVESGRTVALSAAGLPGWLTFVDSGDGVGLLSGLPTAADLGGNAVASFTITLTATDDLGVSSDLTFTLFLAATESVLPTFISSPGTGAIQVGSDFEYAVEVTIGTDATSVALSAGNLPSWLNFVDNGDGTAILTGTPVGTDAGTIQIVITAADDLGRVGTQSFSLVVMDPEAPVFSSTFPTAAITAGTLFTHEISVSLWAGSSGVTITATSLPSWLTLTDHGDGTATLSGTSAFTDAGTFAIVLVATDNFGLSVTQTSSLVVNPALALAPVGNVTISEDGTASVALTITGTATSNILVVVTSSDSTLLPSGGMVVSGSGGSRTVTLTPAANRHGTATITVTAFEGSLSVEQTFTLTVTAVDDPVTNTQVLPGFNLLPGAAAAAVDLSQYFVSGDGAVTFAVSSSDSSLAGVTVSGGILGITPSATRSGIATITVTASSVGDATGQTHTVTRTITFTVVPELQVAGPQILRQGGGYVVRFVVTLLNPSNQSVSLTYATQDGSALAGLDYVAAAGPLVFAPDQTTQTIDIALVGSLLVNASEFSLGFSGVLNARLGISGAVVNIPVDRGALTGLRLPTLTIGFGYSEMPGVSAGSGNIDDGQNGETTDDNFVFTRIAPAARPAVSTIGSELPAESSDDSEDSLESATSLDSLETVREISGY